MSRVGKSIETDRLVVVGRRGRRVLGMTAVGYWVTCLGDGSVLESDSGDDCTL